MPGECCWKTHSYCDVFLAKVTGHSECAHQGASVNNSKIKIDFFTALCGAVKRAGIGLPAKSRAPALVAGWAPRISQNPCFGARLSRFGKLRLGPNSGSIRRNFSVRSA